MTFIIYSVHVLTCLFLVMVVLLQQGSGADLSVFGGGGTMTAFGARGATSLLHKLTVSAFVLFIVTTLSIGVLQTTSGGGSVMGDAPTEAAATVPAGSDSAEEPSAAALPEDDPGTAQGEDSESADPAAEGEAESTEGADGAASSDEASETSNSP